MISLRIESGRRWTNGNAIFRSKANSFRVVNAESDFLSGLIVDKYGDVLVVQISSLGMDQRKTMIVEALQEIFSPRAIVERSEASFLQVRGTAGKQRGSER